MNKLLKTVALCIVLTGCSTAMDKYKTEARAYIEPAAGEKTSSVKFTSDGYIHIYPNDTCINNKNEKAGAALVHLWAGLIDKSNNNRSLGMPAGQLYENSSSTELKVPSNKPLTVTYFSYLVQGPTQYTCKKRALSFVPEDNTQYQVIAVQNKTSHQCLFTVVSLDDPNKVVKYQPAKNCS